MRKTRLFSFQTKVFVSSVIAILLVAGVGLSSYRIIAELIESNRWVNHTHDVNEQLYKLSNLLTASQSSARGYFITGQDYYLKSRETSWDELPKVIGELRFTTRDNPAQQKHLDELHQSLESLRVRWEEVNRVYRQEGLKAVQTRMRGAEAKQRTEVRNELIREMISEENRLLADRLQESRDRSKTAILTVASGCSTAILIVLVSAFMVLNHVRRRRSAEEALSKTAQTLQTLISSSPVGIVVFDENLKVHLWSPTCVSMFGWSESEAIGKVLPYIPSESLSETKAAVAEMTETKSKFETEVERLRKDGSTINVSISAIPLLNAKGEIEGFMAILKDITQRAQIEAELKRASQAKSEFLANMSHEIRTPINGVIGMTGILLDSRLNAEQKDCAETIRRSAESLLTVINDILDFSKVEAGKLDLENVEFDLHQLLRDMHKTMSFPAQMKKISLLMLGDRCWETLFKGDSGRVQQILTNLLSNAIKFTDQGKVMLRVVQLRDDERASEFRFEVTDTGIGIPKDAIEKMFKAFSQADASVTRRFGGTGLGLSISKQLVQLMGGEIGVESAEGKGSTFWFTLRLEKGEPAITDSSDTFADEALGKKNAQSMRILLAEDNAINQKVLLKQLEKLGFRAEAVANGNEAIDALRNVPYDIVFMDCQMPELDGYEATRMIRASQTMPFRDVPIIAVTANAIRGDKERCFEAGMNDYISKPIRIQDLEKLLAKWSPIVQGRAEKPVLDPEILADLAALSGEDGNSLIRELGSIFISTVPKRLQKMSEALGAGNYALVQAEAHQLKSSSGNMGALAFSKLCQKLEDIKDWSSPFAANKLLKELDVECERVCRSLQELLDKAA
jgi:PAS domain S-box-containing protein